MPEVNYTLLKIELDAIPVFAGDSHSINIFVNACDRIYLKYAQNNDVKDVIFQTIVGKLRDRARNLICSRNELNSWSLIKDAIFSYFSDKRDFGQLVQEFNNTKILPKEDAVSFGHRMQDLLSHLMTKLAQSTTIDNKEARAEIYSQTALEVYLLNLPEDIQIHVKPLQPDTLEEAIGQVQDAINFKSRSQTIKSGKTQSTAPQQSSSYQQKKSFPYVNRSITAPNHQFQNYRLMNSNHYPYYPYNIQNQNTSNFPRNQQQQQPVFSKPSHPQQYFTNKQIFPPRNVWLPGQNKPQQKPTPMSGVSTIPPTRQDKFPSKHQEMHNTEIEPVQEEEHALYNEENGLWYVPLQPPPEYEEVNSEEDVQNFSIPASQESLTS